MSLILRDAVQEFITRMEDVLLRLHHAIDAADVDAQLAAFEAIVGLVEMLRSSADDAGDDPPA